MSGRRWPGALPGSPIGPADPGLWGAVVERLNPARARPVLRAGIEHVELVSACAASPYVMLRSPDDGGARLLPAADAGGVAARAS